MVDPDRQMKGTALGWLDWLHKRRGAQPLGKVANPGEGIFLEDSHAIDFGTVRDLYGLLAAIDEVMPNESILYVEGTSICADVRSFLEARDSEESRLVGRGTSWPRPKVFHLPLTGSNLKELRQLAESHAEPEICDHLVVYEGNQVLLSAYDAGSGRVYVSRGLSTDRLDQLRQRLAPLAGPSA